MSSTITGEANVTEAIPPKKKATEARIVGLDTIRIVCAIWVVLRHMDAALDKMHGPLSHVFRSFYSIGFNGPAAVIVFFVISGFCIHYPNRNGKKLDYLSYYCRRYIRIGIPAAVGVILALGLSHGKEHGITLASLNDSVLWSLIAEVIYYTIYPALMFAKARLGWPVLLTVAYIAAYAVVFLHPHLMAARAYPVFGPQMNWVLGLPCWLVGCLLAEQVGAGIGDSASANPVTKGQILIWRLGIWALSTVILIVRFKTPIGYSLTLDLFAIPVYFWLRQEIVHGQTHQPIRWLEAAGAASYSLYLSHPLTLSMIDRMHSFGGHGWAHLGLSLLLISAFAAVFYYLVERPSHLLARAVKPGGKFAWSWS